MHKSQLRKYQLEAIEFVKNKKSCALWVDMGLGKTIIALTAISDLFKRFEIGRVLIIAPLRVAINTWPEQITEWSHTRHLTYTMLVGPKKQRIKNLSQDTDIHIINKEMVYWLAETLGSKWPYDTVIIDEASSFKSARTKRFKALKKVRYRIDRVIELTGTPASNSLLDIWSQIYLLDKGDRLGKTFSGFRDRYFIGDYMGYNYTLRPGAEKKITNKVKDLCITLEARDYIKLPPKIVDTIKIKLPEKIRQKYKKLEKDFLLELEEGNKSNIEALNAATLTSKLLQFCNGAVYFNEGTKEWELIHNEKVEVLDEIIEQVPDQPVMVAYNFRSDLHRLKERFPDARHLDDQPDIINKWNRGGIPLLLAHPASMGHGLNLQSGGHILIWFGLTWSLELYQQCNARLYRQGQKNPVIIKHLVIDDSVDCNVLSAINGKYATQKALMDAVKTDIVSRISG